MDYATFGLTIYNPLLDEFIFYPANKILLNNESYYSPPSDTEVVFDFKESKLYMDDEEIEITIIHEDGSREILTSFENISGVNIHYNK